MPRLVLPTRLEKVWRVRRVLVGRPKSPELPHILRQPPKGTAMKHAATRRTEHGAVHASEGVAEALGISVGRLQKTRSR